jgi:periplasmic protein TonB
MKTKKNQPESFEEIIFKNRNKAYGAFLLRSTYTRTVAVAAVITLFVFSFIVSWAMWNVKSNGFTPPPNDRIIMDSTRIIEMETPPEPPPEKELPSPAPRLLKPVVVDSAVDNTMATQTDLAGNANPPVTITDNPVNADSVILRNDPVPLPEPEPPLLIVKEMPAFPGGDADMVHFLKNNLTYPLEAKEANITGTVYLGFIVERDGSISGLRILRGIGGGCDEEALRVVHMMPKWKPGRQQGHEVRVQFTLPIKFTLQ